jgi:hypothetical protein
MKNDWLSATNFERTHAVLLAISAVSIHAKKILAGLTDDLHEEKVQTAREYLVKFIDQLQTVLENGKQSRDGTMIGTDPQMGNLAEHYLAEQHRADSSHAELYKISLDDLSKFIASINREDFPSLLIYLRELRILVEQNSRSDIFDLLGDI